jgi:hypothetical protein
LPGYFSKNPIRFVCQVCCLVLLLPFLLTCTPSKRIYSQLSDTEYTSPDYRAMLDKWTRKGSIHKGLGTELLVTATYQSEEFRRAFAKEYGRLYMQTPEENQKMLEDQMSAADDYDGFLVAVYTPEKEWDDFAETGSLWKVYLIKDGRFRLEPVEIRKVKKQRISSREIGRYRAVSEAFLPYVNPWTTLYVFRFKRNGLPEHPHSLELILTSPSGSVSLKWDL